MTVRGVRVRRIYDQAAPDDGTRVLRTAGGHGSALYHLRALVKASTVTLSTATSDVEHSQAAVLAKLLRNTR